MSFLGETFEEQLNRPYKKRRFFVDDSPTTQNENAAPLPPSSQSNSGPAAPASSADIRSDDVDGDDVGRPPYETKRLLSLPDRSPAKATPAPTQTQTLKTELLDVETFKAVVGETVSDEGIARIQQLSGGNLERAVNIFFDGSWKAVSKPGGGREAVKMGAFFQRHEELPKDEVDETRAHLKRSQNNATTGPLSSMPHQRYLGSFGVTGWVTNSGTRLHHRDLVSIERYQPRLPAKAGRGRVKRQDVVVRFNNWQGQEVGRLESETAAWVSTLIDQKICTFFGSVIYAPDKLRTNDTIYLQLHCSVLASIFHSAAFVKPEDNRSATFFEAAAETQDERNLRIRQIAMVRLFQEINLQPVQSSETSRKHSRNDLIKAAETSASDPKNSSKATQEPDTNSPTPSDDEEGRELEQDQLDSLYKKAQSFDFSTPEAEPAATFKLDLRSYQKQALHWMLSKEVNKQDAKREQSMHPLWEAYAWPTKDADDKEVPQVDNIPRFYVNPYSGELSLDFPVQEQNCLGGILADEMGLGKTIEMLSLIHTHQTDDGETSSENLDTVNNLPRLSDSSTVKGAPNVTLVVAPMSLLAQWQSEADKASEPGSLDVIVYYGSDKNVDLRATFGHNNRAQRPCVIITSYGVVLSEFNQVVARGGDRTASGGLFSVDYFRVILDEAHLIKNRQSKTAKACYEIKATHRWVLTGTPIVNRLEDLFSLVHFLKVEPWSNFSFWRTFITVPFESKDFLRALDVVQTVLEPLVLRRTKDMKTPDGKPLVPIPPRQIIIDKIELSKEERDVYSHIYARAKNTLTANVEAGTVMKSFTTIFAQILRLRQSCCHPALTRRKDVLAEELEMAAAEDMTKGLADDMDLQNLINKFSVDEVDQDANRFGSHVLQQIQDGATQECPLCAEEPMNEQSLTGCWHSACKQCIIDLIEYDRDRGEVPRCFNCREPINMRDVFEVVRHDHTSPLKPRSRPIESSATGAAGLTTPQQPEFPISLRRISCAASSKISSLVGHLKRLRREDRTTKSVVFSQFTSFLSEIEPALDRDRIPFLRFDGTMAQKARAAVLQEFEHSPKGLVLLLSLRAGGVGLNLTCAKRVFMMDPWWSFAVEAQAIDRVHRMGQDSEVVIHRFIVENSIEEKMLRIQDRKKFIASSLGMMSEDEKKTQRIEDIKELLS